VTQVVYSVVVAVLGVVVGGRVLVMTGLVTGAVPLLLGTNDDVDVDGVEVGFTSLLLLLLLLEGVAEGRVCGIVVE
jgi:hypothetical protein